MSFLRVLLGLGLLIGASCKTHAELNGEDLECEARTEVILVVDRSFSIGHNFKYVKLFIVALLEPLEISPSATRVGIVSYADTRTIEFDLLKYNNSALMSKHVQTLTNQYNGGLTRTMDGLRDAREKILWQRRPDVPVYVILLTDGESNDGNGTNAKATEKTIKQASLIKAIPEVTLIAVGVGPHVNSKELIAVATNGVENVYSVDKFQRLDKELVKKLLAKQCVKEAAPRCEFARKYCDIIFVSASAHVSPRNGQVVLKMAETFATSSPISSSHYIRIGVVPRQCQLDIGYSLDTPISGLRSTTDEKLKTSFLSTSHYLLELAASFESRHDGAEVDARIAVLVLDHTMPFHEFEDAFAVATDCRRNSTLMVVLGVGTLYDENQAKRLASPGYFFQASDYRKLFTLSDAELRLNGGTFNSVFQAVLNAVCMAKRAGQR